MSHKQLFPARPVETTDNLPGTIRLPLFASWHRRRIAHPLDPACHVRLRLIRLLDVALTLFLLVSGGMLAFFLFLRFARFWLGLPLG